MLGVFWGTGVGGGLILDGEPWTGRGAAGELGHMVVKRGGARCPCGRKGCMEAYAGRGAMEAKARRDYADGAKTDLFKIMAQRDRERLTSSIWARALEADDPMAKKLVDRAIKAIAAAAASAVNLLDVEAVIIGGGLGLRLGEPYVREDPQADGQAPVRRREPAGDPARLARRLRRRDRRLAAVRRLLTVSA